MGGRVTQYEHAYALTTEPEYGVTFISFFKVDVTGRYLTHTFERHYRAQVKQVHFFFASDVEEQLFLSHQQENLNSGQDVYAAAN